MINNFMNTFLRTNVIAVTKKADQSKTTDTTLASDNELFADLKGSRSYGGCLQLWVGAANATPDFKYDLDCSGATIKRPTGTVNATSAQSTALATTDTAIGISSTEDVIWIIFRCITDLAARFSLRWSQNTSSATATTVFKGSSLMLIESLA